MPERKLVLDYFENLIRNDEILSSTIIWLGVLRHLYTAGVKRAFGINFMALFVGCLTIFVAITSASRL